MAPLGSLVLGSANVCEFLEWGGGGGITENWKILDVKVVESLDFK